jgi:hypothetical protein
MSPYDLATALVQAIGGHRDDRAAAADRELALLRRYIAGDANMDASERFQALAMVMRHVRTAHPALRVRFVFTFVPGQLDDAVSDELGRNNIPDADLSVVLSRQGMAVYGKNDGSRYNCGEGRLRETPENKCFMCYLEDEDSVMSACESLVCEEAGCGRHALICASCLQLSPLMRYRTGDGWA